MSKKNTKPNPTHPPIDSQQTTKPLEAVATLLAPVQSSDA